MTGKVQQSDAAAVECLEQFGKIRYHGLDGLPEDAANGGHFVFRILRRARWNHILRVAQRYPIRAALAIHPPQHRELLNQETFVVGGT